MPLSLSESALTNTRWSTLQNIFRPLAPKGHVEPFFRFTARGAIAGLGRDTFGNNLRLARHSSRVDGIFINYFEIWLPVKSTPTFALEKAYFHLDAPLPDGLGDEEIFALHCDALAAHSEASYVYKRGPHLHISGNKRDISKSHIALCLSDLDRTCSDFDAYSSAFKRIIKMIDDELLPYLG